MVAVAEKLEITSADIIERIKQEAIARWGEEKWLPNLVRAYVEVAQANGDEKATTTTRRPQIERVFTVGSCTLDTAIKLAATLDCQFQLVRVHREIIKF